jgi:hypothetical protein
MKKAIKINAELQTIEFVTLGNDYKEIYPIIGEQCTLFACPITFDNQDTMYVDDEGLFQGYKHGFMMRGWDYPILGNAVILGTDEEGNSVDAKSLIDDFKGQLVFLEINNDTNTYKFLKSF